MYVVRFQANFAVFSVFLWISRDFMDLPGFRGSSTPQISEALYFDNGDRMKALQTLVTYAEAQKVILEVKIVSIIMYCTH